MRATVMSPIGATADLLAAAELLERDAPSESTQDVRVIRRIGETVTVQGIEPATGRIVAEWTVMEDDFDPSMLALVQQHVVARYGSRPSTLRIV